MSIKKMQGAATIILAVILIVTITLVVLFSATFNALEEKVTSNAKQNNQAYMAAEAGLEFGDVYLQQNSATILANPVNGYIPAYTSTNTQNVVLTDGSKFTISYTNPVQNNYSLIQITVTGTSADGTSTRTISQEVANNSLLSTPPTVPLITKGTVNMTGNSVVSNPNSNSTINSGSTVSLAGSSQTLITGGVVGSHSGTIGGDITQNNAAISSMSNATFFQTYFGSTEAAVQATVKHSYTNSNNTEYSATLNGMSGTSIWITQTGGTAKIADTATIGTAANPVLIIVNGNLDLEGNAVIYGFIYVIGGVATDFLGNAKVYGGIVSTDNLSLAGNTLVQFSSSVLSQLQKQNEAGYFAKVPGTWRDF